MARKNIRNEEKIFVGSKAAHVASYVFLGRIFTFLLTGIALIVVTRLLGPTQYGIYTLAMAFAGTFASLGYFGIGTAMNKFISEYTQKKQQGEVNKVISNALVIVVASGIILTSFCLFFSSTISQYVYHTSSLSYVIQLSSFYIITSILFGAFYDSLLGFGNGKNIAISAGVQAFFQATVSIGLVIEGFGALAPIIGLIVGYFFGFVVGLYLILKNNKIKLVRPSLNYVKKIWSFSIPVGLTYVLGNFLSSGALILLGYYVSSSVIGNIGITARTASVVNVIFDSVGFALLPTFSAAFANEKLNHESLGQLYNYAVYTVTALVGPGLFYISIFALPFTYFVFGGQYTVAPTYISILGIGLLIAMAGSYGSTLMLSANEVKVVFKYMTISNAATLLTVVIFAYAFGGLSYIIGAYIIGPLFMDYLFVTKLNKLFKIKLNVGKLLRLAFSDILVSVIVLPLYLFFSGIILLILGALGFIILYPIIAVKAGGIERADVETIKTLSKQIPVVGKLFGIMADYASLAI